MKDSLITAVNTAQHACHTENSIWMYITFIEFIIIIGLVLFLIKNKKPQRQLLKEKVLNDTHNINFSNITHDWNKAKNLYDILKKKCHPDKFSDAQKYEATRIFQSLVKNKYNYMELLKIKQEAIDILGITITE